MDTRIIAIGDFSEVAGLSPAKGICHQRLWQLADDAVQRRAWAHHQCHFVTGSMIIAAEIAWLALG